MFNFAYENAVVFRINELKNFIDSGTKVEALNFNKMNDYIKSIRNKDGDFVYFGETNEPIVVKGLSSELKAKADENGMIKLSDMVEDLKLRMEKETA
tara:strand:- start:758 stop:1048 length:291 start_codon:yes stop_codon:yes gene_type:complete